jgi:hypothetical protein
MEDGMSITLEEYKMESTITEEYKGYKIDIIPDEFPESPIECDNLGTMVCFHGRYTLGNTDHGYDHRDYNSMSELKADIIRKEDPAVILPLYLYDHSGLRISTSSFSCRFDSGQIGFIFISKKKARYEYNWTNITKSRGELLTKYLINEISTYDKFLIGDVYGYKISKDDEEIDSCWGFYGAEYCLREAKSELKAIIKYELKTHGEHQVMELV